jgi:transcription initiation factor IIE alpha subunit
MSPLSRIKVNNKEMTSDFYQSDNEDGHSEEQLLAYAKEHGLPGCGAVVWLYTERSPCSGCNTKMNEFMRELEMAGQPKDINVLFLIRFLRG